MKNLVKTLAVIILLNLTIDAQPDWVTTLGGSSRYPDALFLAGYGMSSLTEGLSKEQCLQLSFDYARKDLTEKIRVSINAEYQSEKKEDESGYFNSVKAVINSSSSLEIEGLNRETYYDDDGEVYHTLVHVRKDELAVSAERRKNNIIEGLKEKVRLAAEFESNNEPQKAALAYRECFPMFRKLEETEVLVSAAGLSDFMLYSETEGKQAAVITPEIVNSRISAIEKREPLKLSEALKQFAADIRHNVPSGSSLILFPFSYRDTRTASEFSAFAMRALERNFTELGFRLTQNSSEADFRVTGTYWNNEPDIRLIGIIMDRNNIASGSSEKIFPLKLIVNEGLSILPQNFEKAFADKKIFEEGEVTGNGLNLELWTNKGDDALLFEGGETMEIFVRVNLPCYIRLIDHMADGSRVLLLDEYYIDASKVNKVFRIPLEFECAPPFGTETLQLFGQTSNFSKLNTIFKDGYDFIQDDLKEMNRNTRGFKKKEPKEHFAEKRLVLTSIPREKW
ncbi:MAG: DUF4384 domain-containing protein [Ignavibacteriales bacterium]|nr:DUF4384 domain-containing protein [Ignavibacteriales bacterium]MCF8315178.1 DUF4384 domain-containing protein [Ignavibacteriales bacterium]MCF8435826.1 DUF4384 domain-containing protein [Ignavibacteriales bacterium]